MAAVERIVVEHADVEGPILKVLGRYEFYPGRQRVVYLGTRIDVSCWLRTRGSRRFVHASRIEAEGPTFWSSLASLLVAKDPGDMLRARRAWEANNLV